MIAVTDGSGNIFREYLYDPYGNIITVRDGSGSTVNVQSDTAFDHAYTYAGYRYDRETGLYYLNARYYAPGIGRFLTKDVYKGSADILKSLNRYGYSYGDPVNLVDLAGYDVGAPGMDLGEYIATRKLNIDYSLLDTEGDAKFEIENGLDSIIEGSITAVGISSDYNILGTDFSNIKISQKFAVGYGEAYGNLGLNKQSVGFGAGIEGSVIKYESNLDLRFGHFELSIVPNLSLLSIGAKASLGVDINTMRLKAKLFGALGVGGGINIEFRMRE